MFMDSLVQVVELHASISKSRNFSEVYWAVHNFGGMAQIPGLSDRNEATLGALTPRDDHLYCAFPPDPKTISQTWIMNLFLRTPGPPGVGKEVSKGRGESWLEQHMSTVLHHSCSFWIEQVSYE